MKRDALFRGCTRPAMFMGVPYIPFFAGAGGGLLMAMYFHFAFVALIPCVLMVMRHMTRRDEMVFRLLGLRLQFRTQVRNLAVHGGLWVMGPHDHRDPAKQRRS